MPLESWISEEEAPVLAAEAVSQIDAALSRLAPAERDAFWSSVRKCYNTPYNDPPSRRAAVASPEEATVSLAAIPLGPAFAVEAHAV
jgi:hypothetical protein